MLILGQDEERVEDFSPYTENLYRTFDVGPSTKGVQRGNKMSDLRDLKRLDDTRCKAY